MGGTYGLGLPTLITTSFPAAATFKRAHSA